LCSNNQPNSFSDENVVSLLQWISGYRWGVYRLFKETKLNELDEYPNLVITQTLSKAYGLAGIRLGVCYASSQIIAILNK
jgi:histidinol-phosphate aminotransferase